MQPRLSEAGISKRSDLAACRAMLRSGSRTFYAASFLLPRSVREPASALYAFCRLADDAVDLNPNPSPALAKLRDRLDRVYDGRPYPVAADRAFADVVERFAIPKALPEALLEGFEWDAANCQYETLSELQGYAARVAGTVGAMMAMLMGQRAPDVVARACDLGIAMQLTNIARDVGEDARAGRLYLPRQWMQDQGLDPEQWLVCPVSSPALGSVVQRLLVAADTLYQRAGIGIVALPANCRPGINAARLLYAEIGREVERRGLDPVAGRAVVPASRKSLVLVRAFSAIPRLDHAGQPSPLEPAQFLVEAVAAAPSPLHFAWDRPLPWWRIDHRIAWVIALFERMERRERAGRAAEATISIEA